jgi:hypothetical protein
MFLSSPSPFQACFSPLLHQSKHVSLLSFTISSMFLSSPSPSKHVSLLSEDYIHGEKLIFNIKCGVKVLSSHFG